MTAGTALRSLALLVALAGAVAAQEPASGARAASPPVSARERDPASLPRAEPGRWARLFDQAAAAEVGAALAPGVLDTMRIAEAAYAQGLHHVALEALHDVLTREPDFPPGWLVAGAVYLRVRRHSDAVHAYERFLAHAPAEAWRTQGLGHALHALGRYEQARDHYRRVLAAHERSVEARRGLALAELRLGDAAAAIDGLTAVLELAPADADALAWRAQAWLEAGDAARALADADRAGELAPGDPQPAWVAMEALRELGKDEEADEREGAWRRLETLAVARRAVEARLLVDPRQPLLAADLVRLALDARDPRLLTEALEATDRARDPRASRTPTRLAALDAWMTLERTDEARAVALALEAEPDLDRATWQRLALFWSWIGDAERASAADRRARDGAPPR